MRFKGVHTKSTVSTGIIGEANLINLDEIPEKDIYKEVYGFFVPNEKVIQAFKTIRDQVIFTNRRIIVVNVQGITGKKVSYFSYPYSKFASFGVETAGVIDIDSELKITFMSGAVLQFDFKSDVDIRKIYSYISANVL